MGRSAGIAEAVPTLQNRDVEGPSDHQLVAAVRRGDDRAFERLYQRYQRRVQAYVYGMCKDHARAEDISQEIFVSALRRMRETERPIAFKPWIYEIAKNACIDQHRRTRRTEEVSLQAEESLAPADYGRLVNHGPTPDMAVVVKQDLDHLCGAFGGLSETHHEILVMRELEGLSYREIGERLGMSRPAVESTLFRARRRLTEEYDELVSGQRCLRIQGIIATAGRGRLGARDTRRLARHIAHCQPCRREASAAGLDTAMLRPPLRTRVAQKVAALLPFPLLGRRFGRGADGAADGVSSGWVAHAPLFSDHLGTGWAQAAAAVAVLLAGVSAGVGTKVATNSGHAAARPAAVQSHDRAAPTGAGPTAASGALVAPARVVRGGAAKVLHARSGYGSRAGGLGAGAVGRPAGSDRPAGTAPGGSSDPTGLVKPVAGGGTKPVGGGSGGDAGPSLTVPSSMPPDPAPAVKGAVETAGAAGGQAVGAGDGAAKAVGEVATGAAQPVTGAAGSAAGAVGGAAGTVVP